VSHPGPASAGASAPSSASASPRAVVPPGAPAPSRPGLVFFDLDETITRYDTLLPYALRFLLTRRPWRLPLLLRVVPPVINFLLGRGDEGPVKEAFIKATLGGSRRSDIEAWTTRFVPNVIAHGTFADALKKVTEHRSRGDYLVLMSASTDLYVPAIARALGFNETICTEVRWDGDRLDGTLTTPNRKGMEKARCFTAFREHHPGLATAAYGNSHTDLPHLRLADRGVLVNGSDKARRDAKALGVSCVDWR
jgi:phosphatidylglycerophosphatase C